MDWHDLPPMAIEKRSFEIITRGTGLTSARAELGLIIKRVIHTTADFVMLLRCIFHRTR
jgi:precorrin isomerase